MNTHSLRSLILLPGILGFASITYSQTPPVQPANSVCSLISIHAVIEAQQAHFMSSTATTHDDGRFKTATCYYKLEPEYQSVSLEILSPSKTGSGSPSEFWREKFRSARDKDVAEAKHSNLPVHVADVGDDAYWVDTGRDGALYVLQGERIMRLSLGGRTPQVEKKYRAIKIANSALKPKSSSKSKR
jgi:hypothetical protein